MPTKCSRKVLRMTKPLISSVHSLPLRRSPRFSPQNQISDHDKAETPLAASRNNNRVRSSHSSCRSLQSSSGSKTKDNAAGKVAEKLKKLNSGSKVGSLDFELRRSPRLNRVVVCSESLRRSPRLANNQEGKERFEKSCNNELDETSTRSSGKSRKTKGCSDCSQKSSDSKPKGINEGFSDCVPKPKEINEGFNDCTQKSCNDKPQEINKHVLRKCAGESAGKEVLSNVGEGEAGVNFCELSLDKTIKGGEPTATGTRGKKRERNGDVDVNSQEWTREQELALQRAYFVAKPTPHFWKKVARMVPGKSAEECFDKVHSDQLTPSQPPPRSKAYKSKESTLCPFSLSASKLLRLPRPNNRRLSCNKRRQLAHRTVRELLQKHSYMKEDNGADLFSVLEPNTDLSTETSQLKILPVTPMRVQEIQGSVKKHLEGFSSAKHLPSDNRLTGTALISPPVLKQVKNKALHEKYIDLLHSREAKRKSSSTRAQKPITITGKENGKQGHAEHTDVVRAAKNALLSGAKEVICEFQRLQMNPMSSPSDFDDNLHADDEEDEEL